MKKKQGTCNGPIAEKNSILFKTRRFQIIKKAAKLFSKKGYAQTSMREISRETGIDVGNLYYFIDSKEDILFRVFEMVHEPEIRLFENQCITSIEDPGKQLQTVIHELLTFGSRHRDEILLLYRESKLLPKDLLKIIMERESNFVKQIEEILKKGKEKKVFNFDDASFAANMIIYELSLYPLRSWNLKKFQREELMNLIERHIMNAVM